MRTSALSMIGLLAGVGLFAADAAAQGPMESLPEDAVQIQIIATGNNNGELEECG